MKFGIIYELQMQKPWDEEPGVQDLPRRPRPDRARRQGGLRLRLGGRAPLPRSSTRTPPRRRSSSPPPASARRTSASATAWRCCRSPSTTRSASPSALPPSTSSRTGASTSAPAARSPSRSWAASASTRRTRARCGKRRSQMIPKMWSRRRSPGRATTSSSRRATCIPKPIQKPHPPMWMACTQPDSFQPRRLQGPGRALVRVHRSGRAGGLAERLPRGHRKRRSP